MHGKVPSIHGGNLAASPEHAAIIGAWGVANLLSIHVLLRAAVAMLHLKF